MTEAVEAYPPVRWYNSMIVRVMVLCVVLVMCLFGSVYVITRFYFSQVTEEMQARTEEVVRDVVVTFDENPEAELDELARAMDTAEHNVEFELFQGREVPTQLSLETSPGGGMDKVARMVIDRGDDQVLLTVRVALEPQTEILHAFKNEYFLLLSLVFIVALGSMVYFIARLLRPIHDLSETCAQISEGNFQAVTVRKNSGEILTLERTFNRMVSALKDKEIVESNLRQAQRLSALGNLAAGVAHDVRNPLNSIKLLSSHALDNLTTDPGNEGAVKQLQTIRNEVDRLDDIVSGFLSLAKERELKPAPCRIDPLLRECTRLVEKDAERRGVRLIAELRAGDTELMLDAKQWTRAILNVLLNALEACPAGARVRLFSRLTDVTCEVEIRDDGPGMSAEVAERAFEPYYTTRQTGTGLGLSITRGIIEEHHGTIQLSSREGEGCQALITMPLRTEAV